MIKSDVQIFNQYGLCMSKIMILLFAKKSFKEPSHQFSIMSLRNSPGIVNSHEVSN